MKVLVFTHPAWDQKLILAPTADALEHARELCAGCILGPGALVCTQEERSEEDFYSLPEFEG